ncbi:MAG: hypothetical protein AAB909_00430 [Patescibacteria group bacterium]
MNNTTKNGTGTHPTLLGMGLLAISILIFFGFYASNRSMTINSEGKNINTAYEATTSVSFVSTTTTREVANTYLVYGAFTGPAYRNTTYSLTIPGNYEVTPTNPNSYSGVTATASYNFYTNGNLAFIVNVFSDEQWNNIRIQETMNVAEQGGTNSYKGEGRYLGENFSWVFSYIPGAYSMPAGVSF